jgi:hypothetical protein
MSMERSHFPAALNEESMMKRPLNTRVILAAILATVGSFSLAEPALAQTPLKLTVTDADHDGVPESATLSMPGCTYLGGGLGDNCSYSNFGYFDCPYGSDTCNISLSSVPDGYVGEVKVWTWCAIPSFVGECKSITYAPHPPDPLAELIAPIDSTPAGRTYGQWASAYWQWVLGVPDNKLPQQSGNQRVNPLKDLTGQHCGEHQIGDVWFLAGSWVETVTRSCTIPAGKSLFFPFINNAYLGFLNDPPEQRTEKYAHDHAACTQPVAISASLDGHEISDPLSYSTAPSVSPSPAFNVQMPFGVAQGGPGNLFESLGYKIKQVPEWFLSPSAEQGYYLFVKPLPPGPHTLHWSASGCTAGWTQDVTYNLTVLGE